jgi:hypothetical protein
MKRMSIVGLCLIAAFAMSAIAVTSASASAPEFGKCIKKAVASGEGFSDAGCTLHVTTGAKFEWKNWESITHKGATSVMTSELATLESEGGTKISCKHQHTPAFQITGEKTVNGVVGEYEECASSAVPCENTATSGDINTTVLEGEIGVEKFGLKEGKPEPKLNKVATVLYGPGGKTNGGTSKLAEFHCTGLLEVEVEASIMHKNACVNKMASICKGEKFTAAKGEQTPSKFATESCIKTNPVASKDKSGEVSTECDNHNLVSKLKAAGEFEESGQSQTNENKAELAEKSEINTVV